MSTPNLGMTLPVVGGDADAWGTELNTCLTTVDTRCAKVACSAYMGSTQSIPDTTPTKVQYNTEEYDVGSIYDNATNYRLQPTVAGYYLIIARLQMSSLSFSAAQVVLDVYKNGSSHKRLGAAQNPASGILAPVVNGSALVYFNGSTDYAEIFVTQTNGSSVNTAGTTSPINFFQGALQFPA